MRRVVPSCCDPEGRSHAVVLSGGGARAAFEVGVLTALVRGTSAGTGGWPLRTNVLCGSSLGAYNATFLASRIDRGDLRTGLRELTHVWRQQIARSARWPDGGVYRLRGVPFYLEVPGSFAVDPLRSVLDTLRAMGFWGQFAGRRVKRLAFSRRSLLGRVLEAIEIADFFDIEPLRQLVHATIDPHELRRRTDVFLAVACTHFLQGTPKVYFREQLFGVDGPSILLASAAVPGLVPAVRLQGRPFVDGSLSMSVPFLPATAPGTNVLHVVHAWTPFERAVEHDPSTFGTLFRMTRILMASNIYNKLHSLEHFAAEINGLLEHAQQEWDDPNAFLTPWVFDRTRRLLREWGPAVPPSLREIHFYRLDDSFPGTDGFLNFRGNRIDRLMTTGYQVAGKHDCREAGCWLASSPGSKTEPTRIS